MSPHELGDPVTSYEDVVGLALNLERVWARQAYAMAKAIESKEWTSLPESWFDATAAFPAEGESRWLEDAQARAMAFVMRQR